MAEAAPTAQPIEETDLRLAVLNALANAGQPMLVTMLETGEWKSEGNEVVVRVSTSPTIIDMSFGAEAKRVATAAASAALGRPVRVKVVSGGTIQATPAPRPAANGSGRSRAEQDPVVRRMKEKFGAEIRTIIDYKEKR